MPPPGVWPARAAAACALGLWFANNDAVDGWLAGQWEWLVGQWWFRHDSFEPVLSVLSFVVWIPLFFALDHAARWLSGGALKQFMLQPNRTEDMKAWKVEGHSLQQLVVYLLPICTMDVWYPRRGPRLDVAAPTSVQLVQEVFLGLFFYDLYFTVAHYACHRIPWLYRHVHAVHHERQTVRARDTLRLSVAEQSLDVMCSIAALNTIRAHPLSRAVYDVCIVYLLCELHSGWDLPGQLQNLVPCDLWGGSRRHAAHHVEGSRHYQKFFTYLDDLVFHPRHAGARRAAAKPAALCK